MPGPLGFYDLRLPDVMRQQMVLAREYGISAFCSYFYWFAGKTLLEQPLRQWLDDKSLNFPLCLCWANENWSGRWDGRANDILIGQQHSPADDLAFIQHVARYLADPRYLRVDGRPLLLVYRPALLPDPKATATRWREWCLVNGIGEVHLAYVQSFDRVDPHAIGFDAAVEFPPNNTAPVPITADQLLLNPDYRGDVHDWRALARQSMAQPDPAYPRYPCVNPGWDNEPRRSGCSRVFAHASPRGYRDWLRHAISAARRRFPIQPLVFVNAWNEWAEGAVLEPDSRLGHAWLEATRAALQDAPATDNRPCTVLHVSHPELLNESTEVLRASDSNWRLIITTTPEHEEAVRKRMVSLDIEAAVEVFENRGKDILPFLHVANRLLDEGVTTVLKLHDKHSIHRQDSKTRRSKLPGKLLTPERIARIVTAFHDDAKLGLVYAESQLQPLDCNWGVNQANIEYLARRLGIPARDVWQDSLSFGSMLWLRPAALRPLLDAHLGVEEFELEAGQLDGTLAHAVLHMLAPVAAAGGFRTANAATLLGLAETNS